MSLNFQTTFRKGHQMPPDRTPPPLPHPLPHPLPCRDVVAFSFQILDPLINMFQEISNLFYCSSHNMQPSNQKILHTTQNHMISSFRGWFLFSVIHALTNFDKRQPVWIRSSSAWRRRQKLIKSNGSVCDFTDSLMWLFPIDVDFLSRAIKPCQTGPDIYQTGPDHKSDWSRYLTRLCVAKETQYGESMDTA